MISGLKKVALLCVAISANIFTLAATTGAVPSTGTAPFFKPSIDNTLRAVSITVDQRQSRSVTRVPSPIRFREVSGRGLIVS